MKIPIFNITYVMSSSLRSSTCVRMLDSVDPPRNWIKSANANWKGLLGTNTEYFFYVLRNDPTSIPREDLLHVFLAKKNETDGMHLLFPPAKIFCASVVN